MCVQLILEGQQHYQPYLGCREFPATVEFWDGTPAPLFGETRELGWMLHDIDFGPQNLARFFPARLEQGVMHIPEWRASTAEATL